MNNLLWKLGRTIRILSVATKILKEEGARPAVQFLFEKFRR